METRARERVSIRIFLDQGLKYSGVLAERYLGGMII